MFHGKWHAPQKFAPPATKERMQCSVDSTEECACVRHTTRVSYACPTDDECPHGHSSYTCNNFCTNRTNTEPITALWRHNIKNRAATKVITIHVCPAPYNIALLLSLSLKHTHNVFHIRLTAHNQTALTCSLPITAAFCCEATPGCSTSCCTGLQDGPCGWLGTVRHG